MIFRSLSMWALALMTLLGFWVDANPSDHDSSHPISQFFGSIEIHLGMSESDALRLLSSQYAVNPMSGVTGVYAIKEKQGEVMIGYVTITQGHVSTLSSIWTPMVSDAGAFGEALLTALSRLTSKAQGGWRSGEPCSVNIADGLAAGTDTQLRMAEIVCGHQAVSISTSRTNGASSQSAIQLVTR